MLISSATMMEKKETLEVENSETEVPAVASEQSNEPMETQEVRKYVAILALQVV